MASTQRRCNMDNRIQSVFRRTLRPVHCKPKPNMLFQNRKIQTEKFRRQPINPLNQFPYFQVNQPNYYLPPLKYEIIRKQAQTRKKLEKGRLSQKIEASRFSFRVVSFKNHSKRYKLFKPNCLKFKSNRYTDRCLIQNRFDSFAVINEQCLKRRLKRVKYNILNIQDAESIHFYEIKQTRCIEQLLLQNLNLPVIQSGSEKVSRKWLKT